MRLKQTVSRIYIGIEEVFIYHDFKIYKICCWPCVPLHYLYVYIVFKIVSQNKTGYYIMESRKIIDVSRKYFVL